VALTTDLLIRSIGKKSNVVRRLVNKNRIEALEVRNEATERTSRFTQIGHENFYMLSVLGGTVET